MFSCEFCEISHNTFFKEPFGRLLLHKHSFCLLSHHDLLFFQKRCHPYFLVEYFLSLIVIITIIIAIIIICAYFDLMCYTISYRVIILSLGGRES